MGNLVRDGDLVSVIVGINERVGVRDGVIERVNVIERVSDGVKLSVGTRVSDGVSVISGSAVGVREIMMPNLASKPATKNSPLRVPTAELWIPASTVTSAAKRAAGGKL